MAPRNSPRVDRRRRMFVDDSRNDENSTMPRIFRADSEGPTHRYNEAALREINAPIVRYVPLRMFHLVLWFLVGLIPIMGLLLLDVTRPRASSMLGQEATRSFDLAADGNLLGWLASATFGVAVVLVLGIYSVRRHRRDDYRGSFTVWRWALASVAFLSLDAAVGLHDVWQGLCLFFAKTPLWGDGSIWWIGVWAVLFGSILLRLVFEMSSCRIAVGAATLAGGCYAFCGLVELNIVTDSSYVVQTAQAGMLMMGHHLLLFSLVSYARDVVLEAMGVIESPIVRRARLAQAKSARGADEKVAKQTAGKATSSKSKKTSEKTTPAAQPESAPRLRAVLPEEDDAVAVAPKPKSATKPKLRLAATSEEDSDSDSDSAEETPKMSKAERRRLRKEQKRQQRRAA